MKIRVADRDNGLPVDLIFTDSVIHDGDVKDQVHWIKRAIMRAFEHELDECLYAGGIRVHDPHEGGVR